MNYLGYVSMDDEVQALVWSSEERERVCVCVRERVCAILSHCHLTLLLAGRPPGQYQIKGSSFVCVCVCIRRFPGLSGRADEQREHAQP